MRGAADVLWCFPFARFGGLQRINESPVFADKENVSVRRRSVAAFSCPHHHRVNFFFFFPAAWP